MHGLADATDSLDRSGQDWPDRVPIRCAILPMELNIVCFSVAASIHSDRRGEGRAVRAAGIHWLSRYKHGPGPMLVISAGWVLGEPIITTMHHLLTHPGFSW